MNLQITEQKAKRIFPDAPEYIKEILLETFGKECFMKKEFTDIKTFEDACEVINERFVIISGESYDETAYRKLKIIAKAINNGWIPNWNDTNQRKWFPYFNLSSGFGFSFSFCVYVSADTGVGSRLCFETEEKATYAGTQFLELYRDFLTITK